MNINTRFSVCVHILAVIALSKGDNTSELIAKSVNTNPVVIRRLIGQLKKSGLVEVRAGVGGTSLCRPAEEISLLDVYRAVCENPDSAPFHLHADPNPYCYIGSCIHEALEQPLARVSNAMQQSLSETSLADIASFIAARRKGVRA